MVRALPNHSLVDRLVRGRAWIPVLGILLAGVVTMQVEILKLGTSLGRSLTRTTTLQSQNESLQARVATLADDQRIERLAAGMGMVMPTAGMLTFEPAHRQGQLGRAIANIHAPDPSAFAANLASQIAKAALITPAAPATSGANQASGSTSAAGTGGTAAAAGGAGTTTAGAGGTGGTASSGTTTGGGPAASATPAPAVSATPTTSGAPTTTSTPTTTTDTGAAGLPSASTTGGSPGG